MRPDFVAVRGAHQLGGDAHLFAGFAHRALQHVCDVQRACDFGDGEVLALERERGGARRHLQGLHPREQVEQVHGDAVGEIFLLLVGGEVLEGQYGDGLVRHGLRATAAVDEALGEQQHHGEGEHADDEEIQLAPGLRGDRFCGGDVTLELEAFGRELEEPGEGEPEGEADDAGDDEPAHHGVGHVEHRQHLGQALRQGPDHADVKQAGADHVAPLQLSVQAGFHALDMP